MTQAQHSGAWIFVSHSHRDLEKVRHIRNELERRGHNPLLFFLKCLEDDDARLPELIREEIKVREWFILCDSPHAKTSAWVQQEVELIKGMEGKAFETIDLSKDLETELHKLVRLSKRATVFLAYARQDRDTAERIRRALERHDYSVWLDAAIPPSGDWAAVVRSAIDDAVKRGFVLILLSYDYLTSDWCKCEVEYACQRAGQSQRSNVIPVLVTPFATPTLPLQLQAIQWFDLTSGPFDDRMEELISAMKTREME